MAEAKSKDLELVGARGFNPADTKWQIAVPALVVDSLVA